MGVAKQQHIEMWDWRAEVEERSFKASYEAAQSKLRMATLCREIRGADLEARIVALVLARAHQLPSLARPFGKGRCTR